MWQLISFLHKYLPTVKNSLADSFLHFNDYFRTFIKIISDISGNSIFLLCYLLIFRASLIFKPTLNQKSVIHSL